MYIFYTTTATTTSTAAQKTAPAAPTTVQPAPTTSIYPIWTDSGKKVLSDWISNFKKVPHFDEFVFDETNGATSGKQNLCYTITPNTNSSTPPLTFSLHDCEKKAQPVCTIQRKSVYPGQSLPKFPCLKPSGPNRKKRSWSQPEYGT